LKPQFAQAHDNLGIVYARRGETDRAIESFRTALRLDPKNCQAATNLGVALEQNGKVDEARQLWTHALEVDPTCESARRALSKPRGRTRDQTTASRRPRPGHRRDTSA